MFVLLGVSWAVILATPLVQRARSTGVAARFPRTAPRSWPPHQRMGVRKGPRTGWGARRAQRREHERLGRELPSVAELVRVGVSAGLSAVEAVDLVARFGPPGSAAELRQVVPEFQLGLPVEEACSVLVGTPLEALADVLVSADELGVPVEPALARLGAEARTAARRRAETRARTVPVRLLFPLVLLVLPAFGLLAIVPSLLAGFGA